MLRPGITRERLAGLCMLGVLLFSPTLISIFDQGGDATFLGVPLLIVYIFGAWGLLVLIAAGLVIRRQLEPPPTDLEDH